ncbi:nitrous oxide reductase accessory protein NosL [Halovivax sp.]|uniref:nitrous oxide reductase accessory protein NosL n=1 Tax=Halovivax sp. TaxID=1935978 RepID=UPI0025C12B5A|nr:nitrous oxide reductase accessory protein NosL [Halovivax sp.]
MTHHERRGRTRRSLFGTAACATALLLAGCQSGGDDASGSDDGDDAPADVDASSYAIDDHPIDEPVEFGDEHACPICNMRVERYGSWRAQLAHEDGTGLFFDTPGCCVAYVAGADAAGASDEPIETVWMTDFETRNLFEASEGYLVRETDLGRQDFPMGGSPIPFEDRADAEAYVEEYDDLSEDEIVTLDDVDREFAEFYRGNRVPEE